MPKNFLSLILISGILLNFMMGPVQAETSAPGYAFFYFEIDKETYFNPDIIALDLKVEAWESGLNAISFKLDYEPENLTLINTDTNDSICSLVIIEEIDNLKGHYRLDCGTFKGTVLGQLQIARLTFRKNTAGPTLLSSTGESEALANDGLGTKINTVNEDNLVEIIK